MTGAEWFQELERATGFPQPSAWNLKEGVDSVDAVMRALLYSDELPKCG